MVRTITIASSAQMLLGLLYPVVTLIGKHWRLHFIPLSPLSLKDTGNDIWFGRRYILMTNHLLLWIFQFLYDL